MSKVIFIPGAFRGFGKIWAEAFLKLGHQVIATARNLDALSNLRQQYGSQLLTIQLNVNDRQAATAAMVVLVNSTNPPLRLILGKVGLSLVKQAYQHRLAEWEAWQEVAIAAHGF